MTNKSVISVIASPSVIFQRIRGDGVGARVTGKSVTANKSVINEPLKTKGNDDVTVMTAYPLPCRAGLTKETDFETGTRTIRRLIAQ